MIMEQNTQCKYGIVWSVKGKLHRYIHRVGDDANVATGQKDIWLIFVIIGILQSDLDKLHLDCTQDDILVQTILYIYKHSWPSMNYEL